MADDAKPKVILITCCEDKDSQYILKGLINLGDEQSAESFHGDRTSTKSTDLFSVCDWTLENKYYTAKLSLVSVKVTAPSSELKSFVDDAEALVMVFELGDDASFQKATMWAKFFENDDIDIKLLLAKDTEYIKELSKIKEKVTEWCLENSFELVESFQIEDQQNDDFPEKFGFDRIKEALGTHMWPNMVRKSTAAKRQPKGVLESEGTSGDKCKDEKSNVASKENVTSEDIPLLDGNETDLQSFEDIFGKLHEMKLHAESLSDEKRKEYAEQVTLAFWKAMGQSDDEIDGL